jgi:uncharacterized protein YndB with AHSA1/START domain
LVKIEASVIIDRPVEVVWKFMTDWSNAPKWDPGVLELRQTSAGPIGVGATLQARRKDSVTDVLVTEYEPNRKFTTEYPSGPIKGSKVVFSTETIEGKTRLTSIFDFSV